MTEPKFEDIDKQGGWLVLVTTPPTLERKYLVYELDWPKAKDLVRIEVSASPNEHEAGRCEAVWISLPNALGTPAS